MSKKINPHNPVHASKKAKTAPVKHSEKESYAPLNISFKNFIPLGIILLAFSILWFKPYTVKVIDPWMEGIRLIDSAKKATDIKEQNLIMDQAGEKMAAQVQKFPYHARVHFFYGYYWMNRQNWDSAIFQQKEAIRLGAGGIVNQVEHDAQGMLNSALGNKINPMMNAGNYKEAFAVLDSAVTPNMANPGLDKFKGIIYSRQGNSDSALACYLRYMKANPNDADNLTNIGIVYTQKNMRDSAQMYINQALKADPNNANAKNIDSQLNGKKQ